MNDDLQKIRDLVTRHHRFAVLSHVRPDGDAYGSSLALALALQAAGKEITVYNEDGLLKNFQFLPGANLVQKTPAQPLPKDTMLLAVDTSDLERLGKTFVSWQRVPDLNLDHHRSNPGYGKINWILGESPASAQVLYELLIALDLPITPAVAANLYAGLMTDTGSFRFRQTTARSLEIASRLVASGADAAELADQCYRRSSMGRFLLLREALSGTQFTLENRVAYYRLTPELLARAGVAPDEAGNFLDHLQTIDTVEVAFVLEQTAGREVRVSLRSRQRVDVAEIAAQFGGGGHRLAAGLRSALPPAELEEKLLQAIQGKLAAMT